MKVSASIGRFGMILCAAFVLAAGCKPKPKAKPVTDLQRKEAEMHMAEASFAVNLKDWPRAEGAIAKAVQSDPNNGGYGLSLGSARVRLGNKAGAKQAYEGALKAYQVEAADEARKNDPEPWLKQMQVLALLGRTDDGRAMLEKTAKRFPENRNVRAFVDSKQFDQMLADPVFKQGAL